MADTPTSPLTTIHTLTLEQFLSQAKESLYAETPSLSAIDILTGAQYYEHVRDRINALDLPFVSDDATARERLYTELSRIQQEIAPLPQKEAMRATLGAELPTTIATRGRLLTQETDAQKQTLSRDERLAAYRAQIVKTYIQQSRKLTLPPQDLDRLVGTTLKQTDATQGTTAQVHSILERIEPDYNRNRLSPTQQQHLNEAHRQAEQTGGGTQDAVRTARVMDATAASLAKTKGLTGKPAVAFAIAQEVARTNPTQPPTTVASTATTHATILQTLSGAVPDGYRTTGKNPLADYANQAQGGLGKLLSSVLPMEALAEYRVVQSIKRFGEKLQNAGETLTESPLFADLYTKAQRYQQPEELRGGIGRIAAGISDTAGYVFGDVNPTIGIIYEDGKVLYKHLGPDAVDTDASLYSVHAANIVRTHPYYFSLLKSAEEANEAGGISRRFLGALFGGLGSKLGGFFAGTAAGGPAGDISALLGSEFLSRIFGSFLGTAAGKRPKIESEWKSPIFWMVGSAVLIAIAVPILLQLLRGQSLRTNLIRGYLAALQERGDEDIPRGTDIDRLACINYPNAPKAFTEAVNSEYGKNFGQFACALNCPTRKITFGTRWYIAPDNPGYWGFAPSDNIGHLFLYLPFFLSPSPYRRARLVAHELMHQVSYFRDDIYQAYLRGTTSQPRGYCGKLGTYPFGEEPTETFADAGAAYLMGDRDVFFNPSKAQLDRGGKPCPQGYEFMRQLFESCANQASAIASSACSTETGTAKTIQPIGDSITTIEGYPTILGDRLKTQGHHAEVLPALSMYAQPPGAIIDPAARIVAQRKPDYVLIHAGTNKVNSNLEGNKRDIETLVNRVKQAHPSTTILLATIIQRYDANGAYQEDVTEFNKKVRSLEGPGVIIVEMERLLTRTLVPDTIHPSPDGYAKMVDEGWLPKLTAGLVQCTQATPERISP